MEAVLMALCSCTSVDVVSILKKKRQPLTALRVSASAEQSPAPPRVFTNIKLTYSVSGKLSRKAVEDAVSLSKNTYCSVSKMLEKSAAIEYEIVFVDGEPEP
jgi:putative redox protein